MCASAWGFSVFQEVSLLALRCLTLNPEGLNLYWVLECYTLMIVSFWVPIIATYT